MRRLTTTLAVLLVALTSAQSAQAEEEMTVDEIIDIAISGVGSRYVWGGGCWDPANRSRLGADCSGYVAKCWQVPGPSAVTTCSHPYSTYNFRYETPYWDNVDRSTAERGDAYVYRSDGAGHVVLYVGGDPWGSPEIYEARGSAYGIVHRTRSFDSSWRVRRRHSLVDGEPGGGGSTVTSPLITLAAEVDQIESQPRDFCVDGDSAGVFDSRVGQSLVQRFYVANEGDAVAGEVVVGITIPAGLEVRSWEVLDDWPSHSCDARWCPNDCNERSDNPDHLFSGGSFTLHLDALSPDETKMIVLNLDAVAPSYPDDGPLEARLWVREIDAGYRLDSYDGTPTNRDGLQTWNGGDLRLAFRHDVVGDESCNGIDDDCDGAVDEIAGCDDGGDDGGDDDPIEDPAYESWIGGPCRTNDDCITGLCINEARYGYPDGTCTQACTLYCPDRSGHPTTFCVALGGEGYCLSRQDYSFYSDSGCREGYHGETVARISQSWMRRSVCVPPGFDADDAGPGYRTSVPEGGDGGDGTVPPLDDGSGIPGGGVMGHCSVAAPGPVPPPSAMLMLLIVGACLRIVRRW